MMYESSTMDCCKKNIIKVVPGIDDLLDTLVLGID